MITQTIRYSFALLTFAVLVLIPSCKPDDSDDDIPYIPFEDIVINVSLPEYFVLQPEGGYKYVEGGVRGIIVYHKGGNTYYAFERNCSLTPNEACSTVEVEGTGLRMFDPCCGSIFDFEGNPISGPAWRPLRKYVTEFASGTLTITDDVEI